MVYKIDVYHDQFIQILRGLKTRMMISLSLAVEMRPGDQINFRKIDDKSKNFTGLSIDVDFINAYHNDVPGMADIVFKRVPIMMSDQDVAPVP